jgi:four helix bundle protein
MSRKITSHRDLEVYRRAFDAAMQIFEPSRKFPKEETSSLADQIRRSSRSAWANITEAWRKRRYEAAFTAKLSDEAAETQTWLEFAVRCGFLAPETGGQLNEMYEKILVTLVSMICYADSRVLPSGRK